MSVVYVRYLTFLEGYLFLGCNNSWLLFKLWNQIKITFYLLMWKFHKNLLLSTTKTFFFLKLFNFIFAFNFIFVLGFSDYTIPNLKKKINIFTSGVLYRMYTLLVFSFYRERGFWSLITGISVRYTDIQRKSNLSFFFP